VERHGADDSRSIIRDGGGGVVLPHFEQEAQLLQRDAPEMKLSKSPSPTMRPQQGMQHIGPFPSSGSVMATPKVERLEDIPSESAFHTNDSKVVEKKLPSVGPQPISGRQTGASTPQSVHDSTRKPSLATPAGIEQPAATQEPRSDHSLEGDAEWQAILDEERAALLSQVSGISASQDFVSSSGRSTEKIPGRISENHAVSTPVTAASHVPTPLASYQASGEAGFDQERKGSAQQSVGSKSASITQLSLGEQRTTTRGSWDEGSGEAYDKVSTTQPSHLMLNEAYNIYHLRWRSD